MKKPIIKFVSEAKIEELRPWVNQILDTIGYPGAWVSNRSMIWDFCLDDQVIEASKKLGIEIDLEEDNYIHELAQKLKGKKNE